MAGDTGLHFNFSDRKFSFKNKLSNNGKKLKKKHLTINTTSLWMMHCDD